MKNRIYHALFFPFLVDEPCWLHKELQQRAKTGFACLPHGLYEEM
jgi:hypothetical protein